MIESLLKAIEEGDDKSFEAAFSQIPKERLSEKDKNGNTALHLAAKKGNLNQIIRFFKISEEFATPNNAGDTPLALLLKHAEDQFAPLLIRAIYGYQWDLIDQIVAQKQIIPRTINLSSPAANGDLLFQTAVKTNNSTILDLLRELNANPHVVDKRGLLPIHCAILMRDVQMVNDLLEMGKNINVKDLYGRTPLHYATELEDEVMVKHLLLLGADKDLKNAEGAKPLDIAVMRKNLTTMQLLGGNVEVLKKSPAFGTNYSQEALNKKLIDFCHNLQITPNFISKNGNCNGWSFLYQYYVALNQEDTYFDMLSYIQRWDGRTASLTCQSLPESVKKLKYDNGKPIYKDGKQLFEFLINDLSWYQVTSKMAGITFKNIKQDERILQWQLAGNPKFTLQEIAKFNGLALDKEGIKNVIDLARSYPNSWLDITVDYEDDAHSVALYITPDGELKFYDSNFRLKPQTTDSTSQVVDYLFIPSKKVVKISGMNLYQFAPKDKPLNLSKENKQFSEKLAVLKKEQPAQFLKIALSSNLENISIELNQDKANWTKIIDINETLYHDHTYASIATYMGNVPALQLIKECGATNINQRSYNGFTPIHLATIAGNAEAIKELAAMGCDINLPDENGETVFHHAIKFGQTALIPTLHGLKANINAKNESGKTTLHYACSRGDAAQVSLLLSLGADSTLEDNKGRKPRNLTLSPKIKGPGRSEEVLAALDRVPQSTSSPPQMLPSFTKEQAQKAQLPAIGIPAAAEQPLHIKKDSHR